MTKIAVLGTGHMGTAMTRRLLATGHAVTVWNRHPHRAALLGVEVAESAAQAARDADVVIIMLTDFAAVDAVLFQPTPTAAVSATVSATAGADTVDTGTVAQALRPGSVLIQMSTIGPDQVRDLGDRLPDGIAFVDAPVGGSVGAAEAGELVVLAGGTADAIDRAAPVLSALGTVRRCGDLGGGSALKLVLNTALVTAVASLADVLAVADGVGVDRSVALDALAAGPLAGAIKRATATGASFALALAAKDLDLARRELASPAPVLDAVARVLGDVPDPSADIAALIHTPEGQ